MPTATIATLLAGLLREPGRPRVTWYGDDHERVELSGAVLDNWVSKTANLLVEELDAAPGTRVRLDLPAHWRTVVWALAAWRVGACVVLDDGDAADVLVTSDAGADPTGAALVVVTLPALARRAPGPLPPRAIDAAAAVMTYGDVLAWAPPVRDDAPALVVAGSLVTHADLPAWAGPAEPDRVLVPVGAPDGPAEPAASVRATLATLAAAGSVVLAVPAAVADPAARERLVTNERVTRTA